MIYSLNIRPDGGEILQYNKPAFPVRCVDGDLSHFHDFAAGCHWHNDFEILIAKQGDLDYFVNGAIIPVHQGEAIFVNANRLHYGFSSCKRECLYSCIVFHPDLFGVLSMTNAGQVAELSSDTQPGYVLIQDSSEIQIIQRICALFAKQPYGFELAVQGSCAELLYHILSANHVVPQEPPDTQWLALRAMIGYLQVHYGDTIRLEEIAAAGAVCRSRCCQLFREKMNMTPIQYLNRYRIEKARELLLTTALPITEISKRCGFDSPSYFSELFRRAFGRSPKNLRMDGVDKH